MATGNVTKEFVVRDELGKFLQKNDLKGSIESIDEIVLTYVMSILEDLGNDSNAEENIDVEQVVEMMEAYIPGFSSINSVEVIDWMFKLASHISKSALGENECQSEPQIIREDDKNTSSISAMIDDKPTNGTPPDTADTETRAETVDLLLEMFPSACAVEVTHCLQQCQGDAEQAAQLLLDRCENTIPSNPSQSKQKLKKNVKLLEDPTLKKMVIQRYGYQDTDLDKKTFKPVAPKTESKKMIRYLDNRIVSTKGEKFTEIKKEETEEMKKTYVNLKPARQYRFH